MLIGKLLGEHSTGIGRLERQRHVLWPGLGQTSLTAPALSKIKCGQPIYVYEKHRATYAFFGAVILLYLAESQPASEKRVHTICQTVRHWQLLIGEDGENVWCEHVFGLATYAYCILKVSLYLQVGQVQALLLFQMGRCRCRIGAKWHVTEQVLRMSVLLWIRELKQKQELFVAWGAHQWCIYIIFQSFCLGVRIPTWSSETQTSVSSHWRIKTHFCTGSPGTSFPHRTISHIIGLACNFYTIYLM